MAATPITQEALFAEAQREYGDAWLEATPDQMNAVYNKLRTAQLYAPVEESAGKTAYTQSHAMSREDFLQKYGTTFVADDKGGNAASEVAGMDVGQYYDNYIGPNRMTHSFDGDGNIVAPSEGNQVYGRQYWDAYDEVNPHPESQVVTGVQGFINHMKPLAAMAAMAYGANALVGGWATAGSTATYSAGAALDAGITAATTAPGVAGMVGMAPGMAATAVNAGVLNTGVSLAMGKNIGDSLKSGVTAAALSGVGGWASEGIKGATASLGVPASRAIAAVGSGAVTGAAGAAINGTDIGKGALTGMTTGAISEASEYVGRWAKDATKSADVGRAASTVTSTVLNGGDVGTGLVNAAVNQVSGDVGKTVGGGYTGALVSEYAKSALTGKKLNKRSLLTSLANTSSRNNRTNLNDNA